MIRNLIILLFCFQGMILAQTRFILESELLTNHSSGGANKTFTRYSYDVSGNRIDRRVFDGVDSTAALMSREKFSYDEHSRVTEDLLLSPSGDTLSIVNNTYGPSGLVRVAVMNKNGSIRFVDSLYYENGLLSEQRRYSAASALTYFHRYSYVSGLLSADSLFESDGAGGFTPTQARLVLRNTDSTIAKETQWRKSGTSWYPVGTTVMTYDSKKCLTAATSYETDGNSKKLTDSLAYINDANGNRTNESKFDNERLLTYDIIYTWLDTQPVSIRPSHQEIVLQRLTFNNGKFEFSAPFSGSVAVYTVNGREIGNYHIDNARLVQVNTAFAPGKYYVMTKGTVKQTLSFTKK